MGCFFFFFNLNFHPTFRDYKEYHTDSTVKFIVKMTPEKLAQAEETGLHKLFKLQSTISATSMVSLTLCSDMIQLITIILFINVSIYYYKFVMTNDKF